MPACPTQRRPESLRQGPRAALFGLGTRRRGAAAAITVPPTVNATTFTQGTIPSSGSGTTNTAESVSCTLSTFCIATGQTGGANGALIEQWNGTTWSVVSNAPVVAGPDLKGVSCVGTTFCAAAGAGRWRPRHRAVERHGVVEGEPAAPVRQRHRQP